MSWLLAGMLLLGSISQEVKQLIEHAGNRVDEEALEFLKALYSEASVEKPSKCPKCRQFQDSLSSRSQNLLVFMSFSVPLESWKEWSLSMEKEGGLFVLRGLPENSFRHFSQKIAELRKSGVNIPICIDPESYENFCIETVPSVVLLKGEKYDKISGNIRPEVVLRIFSENEVDRL